MPSTADVFLRLRVDPAQVKADTEKGLSSVDTRKAGQKAGTQFGQEFAKAVEPQAGKSGSNSAEQFVKKFSSGFSVKRAAITAAVTAALAVGPAAIAGAGALIGVAFAAAAGAAIYKNLTAQLKTATAQVTAAQKSVATSDAAKQQLSIAILQLQAAEKGGNAASIATAKLRVATLQAQAAGAAGAQVALANALKQQAALKAQIAQYQQVKNALTGLKATLVTVGSTALINSGILKAMASAITGLGAWLSSNQALFTDFFRAAAPYVPVFTKWFEDLTGILLPQFTRLMQQGLPAVKTLLAAFNSFVRSGVGGFLAQVGQNAGVSAQAFGVLLNQLAPLLPLLGALAGVAARLIVAFPPLVPVIIGLSVAMKGLLIASAVAAAIKKLAEVEIIASVASRALAVATAAIPWVLIGLAVIAVVAIIIKYWGPISAFFVKIWHDIYSGFIAPIVNFFTKTVPDAFKATIDWLQQHWPLIVLIVTAPLLAIVLLAIKFRHDIGQAFTDAWNDVVKIVTAAWNAIVALFRADVALVTTILTTAWHLVQTVTSAVWDAIKAFFSLWWATVTAIFTGNTSALQSKLAAVWAAIRSVAESAWNAITAAWSVFWGTITSVASAAWGKIQSGLSTFFGWVKTGFTDLVSAVGSIWSKVEQVAEDPVRFIIGTVYNKGIVPVVDAIAGVVGLHPLNAIAGFASGTGGAPRGWAWVGEQGPELAYFHGGEQVLSNPQSMAAVSAGVVRGFASGTSGPTSVSGRGGALGAVNPTGGNVITGVVSSVVSALRNLAGDALAAGINAVLNPLLSAIPGTGNPLGGYVKSDITKVTTEMVDWIKGKSAATSSQVPNVGSGTARWKGIVDQALKLLGLSTSLDARVLYQMQTESGGNPNAINLTDSNAQAGDPSRGLMQVIMSTFQQYHVAGTSSNIYDPLANIAAAISYARAVYGPTLMSNGMGIGSGHGYANGGWVNEPVYGIGASGQRYSFGERGREYVMSGNDMATVIGLLKQLNATTAAVPAATGRHVGGAINGVGSNAAYRDRYPMVR